MKRELAYFLLIYTGRLNGSTFPLDLDVVGIFRRAPNNVQVRQLKQRFDEGEESRDSNCI